MQSDEAGGQGIDQRLKLEVKGAVFEEGAEEEYDGVCGRRRRR